MAKFYRSNVVVVSTRCAEGVSYDVPADVEYRVRSLGRGLWSVIREDDGFRWTMSTSKLQRFFRPEAYECGYYSSGEPQYFISEVYITRA